MPIEPALGTFLLHTHRRLPELTITNATGNSLIVDTTTLVVDATNNRVGIGTASPSFVVTMSYTAPASFTNAGADFLHMWQTGTTNILGVAAQTTNKTAFIVSNNNYDISLITDGVANRGFTIKTITGRVGVGTSSPGALLDVRGSAIFNEDGADADFRWESDTKTNGLFADATDGTIYINDSSNAFNTGGLTINQGADDNEILSLKSSDVAHGMTSITETDTFGYITKVGATDGGINMAGFTEATIGFQLAGVQTTANTTKSSSGTAAIMVKAYLKSGTSLADVGADGNLFSIGNRDTTRFIFDAEGDFWLAGDIDSLGSEIAINEAGASVDVRIEGDTATHLIFADGSADFVGINNSAPIGELTVTSTSAANSTRGIFSTQHNDGVQGAGIGFRKSRGTPTSPTTVASGDYGGFFQSQAYVSTSGYITPASFGFRINGTVTGTAAPTEFFIHTGSTNDTDPFTNGTIRLLVSPTGKVGIGTVTPANILDVAGPSGVAMMIQLTSGSANAAARNWGIGLDNNAFGNLEFMVSATQGGAVSQTPKVVISSGGNVGIGTTAPNYLLDLATSSSNTQFRFGSDTANSGGFLISTATSQALLAGGVSWNGTNWIARDTGGAILGSSSTDGVISFFTNASLTVGNSFTPTERMRIDSSGRVFIGGATTFYVAGETNNRVLQQIDYAGDGQSVSSGIASWAGTTNPTTAGPLFILFRSRGTTIGTLTAVANNDHLGTVLFRGDDGVAGSRTAATIAGYVDGTPGSADMPGRLVFSTTPDGSAVASEALRIDSSQRVGIGVTPTAVLHLKAGTATASTAPLKFTTGTLLTTAEAGAMEFLTDAYYVTTTTGAKRRMVVAGTTGRATGQVAANASVATYTLGATDASYEISANVLVTTSSAEAFTVEVTYTDEGNTARTLILPFVILAGTTVAAINFANGAIPYEGVPVHLRCKASTAITVLTQAAGVYTGATYNVEAVIKQIA